MFSPLVWAVMVAAPVQAAQVVEGAILRIEGPEIYAAIGHSDGLRAGQVASVYQRVSVKSEGRVLEDHFLVGKAQVVEVGSQLTLLRGEPDFMARVSVGDMIRVGAAIPINPITSVRSPTETSSAETTPNQRALSDEELLAAQELAEFRDTFMATSTATPEASEQLWRAYLVRWPDSPVGEAITTLIEKEKELSDSVRIAKSELAALQEEKAPPPITATAVAVTQASVGDPIPVTVSIEDVTRVEGATLFYRRDSESSFRFVNMEARGDTAFGANIPAEAVHEPAVHWFVQLRSKNGDLTDVGGVPEYPVQVQVTEDIQDVSVVDRSQISVAFEQVDFYSNQDTDEYSHAEIDTLYRLGSKTPLYSVRMGFGVYKGIGGEVDKIDNAGADWEKHSMPVGYNYGYTELEFTLTPFIAVIGRGLVGVDHNGMAAGGNGRVRLGSEEGTNMELGAARIGNIGDTYLIQLSWDTVPRVPMSGGVHVTNHPGVSTTDFGVRLVYEARYALTDWVELGGRLGYNLRNINHSGPSYGLAGVFSW